MWLTLFFMLFRCQMFFLMIKMCVQSIITQYLVADDYAIILLDFLFLIYRFSSLHDNLGLFWPLVFMFLQLNDTLEVFAIWVDEYKQQIIYDYNFDKNTLTTSVLYVFYLNLWWHNNQLWFIAAIKSENASLFDIKITCYMIAPLTGTTLIQEYNTFCTINAFSTIHVHIR